MKVLITAKNGQLGWELQQSIPDGIDVVALNSSELDITDSDVVSSVISREKPDFVINAAAYTAVDNAESDKDACFAVNYKGIKNLANACKATSTKLIHISTDFVFNGEKNTPYKPCDESNPLGVYGESKRNGELALLEELPCSSLVIRTAWVYSAHGNNFVKTMLRLMTEKPQLGVVYDQVGTPTWAGGLAKAIWQIVSQDNQLNTGVYGKIYHWTDAGVTSWYDFAVAIQQQALELGLLDKEIPIKAIPASAYPTPAKRPSFSVLDKSLFEQSFGVDTIHWQQQLKIMLMQLKQYTNP
ncbi:dTDP-4-dehydrorhamnose reductase [Thalassomonas sp. M1454]|uniref:dTDP-4-dehydrorhamnose reductase n=1 Tax=Thalassomonas sp. M1454 TaxID=2594477 RepID=UPI00117FBA33|nr:dTDP-4-dehydrorhamnose reductase [Thalassomonas sp. M1454]TRX57408.1 dTDP-4-dehydrorhamnose reductase [Thalassomonas sp. M1454]